MGILRMSGKRRWSMEDENDLEPNKKTICTSPPYELCPDHVLPYAPSSVNEILSREVADTLKGCHVTTVGNLGEENDREDPDSEFCDDEEDKDSGFIDGNSIDNSDEEDEDKVDSCKTFNTEFQDCTKKISDEFKKTDISSTMTSFPEPIRENCPKSTTNVVFSKFNLSTTSVQSSNYSFVSSVPISTYTSELYESRPSTPVWSCNFYDGSQPSTTNKYMEISPSKSPSNQSIQCDENGKSYLELGGPLSYNANYNKGDIPTNYNNNNKNFTASPNFLSNNYGHSHRAFPPPFNSPYVYHKHSLPTRSSISESPYTYCNNSYSFHNNLRSLSRGPVQRCSSPACDLTKIPRPVCYQQQRYSVLNMSMFKLNKFSRFVEPSLHRSVLICNTLRHIEKEMEGEGLNMGAMLAHTYNYGFQAQSQNNPHCKEISVDCSSEGPLPSMNSPASFHSQINEDFNTVPSNSYHQPTNYMSYCAETRDTTTSPFELTGRENYMGTYTNPTTSHSQIERSNFNLNNTSTTTQSDSQVENLAECHLNISEKVSADDRVDGINWCSVLSLPSQPDIDSLNNNDNQDWSNERVTLHHSPITSDTNSELSQDSFSNSITTTILTLSSTNTSSENSRKSSSILESTLSPISPVIENVEKSAIKLPSLSVEDVLKSFPEHLKRQDIIPISDVLVDS